MSIANKVHLPDFTELTLHERFAPLHSCKSPPHQTPAPLHSHGRDRFIDYGGMTRFPQTHNRWFGPVTQSRIKHSPQSFIAVHKLSHRSDFGATQSADELPCTSALIFTSSLTGAIWDRYTLCGRRTLRAPTHAAKRRAPLHNLWPTRQCLSEPPIFYAFCPASGRVGPTRSGSMRNQWRA